MQKFCRRIAQQCWSTEDIATLLDRDEGTIFDNNMDSSARLQLDLDCHAKEVLYVVLIINNKCIVFVTFHTHLHL